ncbi:DotG/IcmE/VirB10 family protein [Acidithiobacillus thiooxidans]|uniref:DotG/IcmE/VirB10 family protein n=1 Tax=Acidithiobacillus thiooxidans TaxID=930 RepID=UPI00285C7098|nr:DotG/IcmE/VirB10 family protein [Acidithiobacillus thiooxidans]MDR7926399.1 DotG/IcmE/VirB10 family protein [Acidithiobacillus thiooxidans]
MSDEIQNDSENQTPANLQGADPSQSADPTQDQEPPVRKKVTFAGNLKRFYTSPETRFNAILLTAIAGAMIAFGLYSLTGDSGKAVISRPGSAHHVKNLPGGDQGGALYDQNLNKLNAERAKEAAQNHQTFIPTLGALHPVAPVQSAAVPKPAAKKPAPAPAPAAPAAPKETAWQKTEAKDAQLELMRFVHAPVPVPLTTSLRVAPANTHFSHDAQNTGPLRGANPLPGANPILANPGHIAFGELLTALNSNEPGPVEAEIVSGRFKGAKVLGNFKREKDRLVVAFDEMTWNHQSYPISAYAINAKTARTYIATSVNHHTLARWGSLIAASFLGGVDNALDMANESETFGNGYAVVANQMSDGQIPLYAAGNVGNVLTPILAKRFNEPPTVREAQGAAIGLLFMKPVR